MSLSAAKLVRDRRGVGMVDVMITVILLAMTGILFSAVFPAGTSAIRQSGETRTAVSIAQRTLEQVKELGYESLSAANLQTAGLVDISSTSSPYTFTQVASLSQSLASPTGTLTITDDSATVKRVTVTILWKSSSDVTHNVTLSTLVADMRARAGT